MSYTDSNGRGLLVLFCGFVKVLCYLKNFIYNQNKKADTEQHQPFSQNNLMETSINLLRTMATSLNGALNR